VIDQLGIRKLSVPGLQQILTDNAELRELSQVPSHVGI
jgi:hypothetical protein